MRDYINLVEQLVESILAELEEVPVPENTSKEIGSGGRSVENSMSDMLPHHGVFDRNKPQAFSQVFAATVGKTEKTGFEREAAPGSKTLQQRRNNHASAKKLKTVPAKGDQSATLHSDFAHNKPNNRSILPQ